MREPRRFRQASPGRRRWPWSRSAAVLVAGVAAFACESRETDPQIASFHGRAREGLPNIILITVDTLRADHLGLYGYDRPTTPGLDARFSSGTVFRRAHSTETHTAPSVVSILSGLHPQQHGVRMFFQLLPAGTSILPDLLPSEYETAAFVSNLALTDEALGLASRFDHFDDYVDEKEPFRDVYERSGARTTDAALGWLVDRREPERPLFLWVHYMDPHGPYRPPSRFGNRFTHSGTMALEIERVPEWVREPGKHDALEYIDRYDGEIAYMDAEVSRLLDALDLELSERDSYTLFTADHGETLTEHELWFSHGYHVYQELIHVPLMLEGPGIPEVVRDEVVSTIDLVPTMLSLVYEEIDYSLPGRNLLAEGRGVPALAESTYGGRHRRAAVHGQSKWIASMQSGAEQIEELSYYDLQTDPSEQQPLEAGNESVGLVALRNHFELDPDRGGEPADPVRGEQLRGPKISPRADEAVREKLRSMGYVN